MSQRWRPKTLTAVIDAHSTPSRQRMSKNVPTKIKLNYKRTIENTMQKPTVIGKTLRILAVEKA